MAEPSRFDKDDILAQIGALAKLAASANDPSLTAKAVAFSDAGVQELFFSKLAQGHNFVGQRAFPGSEPSVIQVLFEFVASPEKIALFPPSFMAVVSLPERSVLRTADPALAPYIGGIVEAGALPFTVAVPSNAPNVITPGASVIDLRSREAVFFEALPGPHGAEPSGAPPGPIPAPVPPKPPSHSTTLYYSPYDTAVASTSNSGGVADDSTTDWQTDTKTDQMLDRSD